MITKRRIISFVVFVGLVIAVGLLRTFLTPVGVSLLDSIPIKSTLAFWLMISLVGFSASFPCVIIGLIYQKWVLICLFYSIALNSFSLFALTELNWFLVSLGLYELGLMFFGALFFAWIGLKVKNANGA